MSEFAGSPVEVEHSTTMAVEEKKKLQKSLRRFDMLFFTVCALVGLDTLGQVSSWGAQTFTWLIVLAVLFVLPYALLMAELGSAFTQEGGPYEWMKLCWGRFWAGIGALLYWVTNPLWVGGSLAFISTAAWSSNISQIGTGTVGDYFFKVVFIWVSITVAIVSLRRGKWIPNVGAIIRRRGAGVLLDHRCHLRDQARRAWLLVPPVRAQHRHFPRPGAAASVQLRRLRASERRRRGDARSAEGRPQVGHDWRGHHRALLRHSDLRHPGGASDEQDQRHRRVPGRNPHHVQRLRWSAELPGRCDGAGLHLRPRDVRQRVDDGLRPDPGGCGLRRRLRGLVRPVQLVLRHAGARERHVGHRLDHLHGRRGAAVLPAPTRARSWSFCTSPHQRRCCPTS